MTSLLITAGVVVVLASVLFVALRRHRPLPPPLPPVVVTFTADTERFVAGIRAAGVSFRRLEVGIRRWSLLMAIAGYEWARGWHSRIDVGPGESICRLDRVPAPCPEWIRLTDAIVDTRRQLDATTEAIAHG